MEATGARRGHATDRVRPARRFAGLRIARASRVSAVEVASAARSSTRVSEALPVRRRQEPRADRDRRSWARFGRAAGGARPSGGGATGSRAAGWLTQVRSGTAEGWLVLEDIPESVGRLYRPRARARPGRGLDARPLGAGLGDRGKRRRPDPPVARPRRSRQHRPVPRRRCRSASRRSRARRGRASKVDADLTSSSGCWSRSRREIRSFVSALRRDREFELDEVVEDLRALAVRLSQQWSIDCTISTAHEEAADSHPTASRPPAIAARGGRQRGSPRRRRPGRGRPRGRRAIGCGSTSATTAPGSSGQRRVAGRTVVVEGTGRPRERLAGAGVEAGTHQHLDQPATCAEPPHDQDAACRRSPDDRARRSTCCFAGPTIELVGRARTGKEALAQIDAAASRISSCSTSTCPTVRDRCPSQAAQEPARSGRSSCSPPESTIRSCSPPTTSNPTGSCSRRPTRRFCSNAWTSARRQAWVDPEIAERTKAAKLRAVVAPPLTPRERELVELVRQGLRNRDIAAQLGVTEGTVKVYLHSIFDKVGVANRTELAIRASGLIGS